LMDKLSKAFEVSAGPDSRWRWYTTRSPPHQQRSQFSFAWSKGRKREFEADWQSCDC